MMQTKQILWTNIQSLMIAKFGEVNLYKTTLASAKNGKEKAISLGSLQKIKKCDTAIGLDVADKIAEFFEIETWQLFVPNLEPKNPPVLRHASEKEKEFYERIKLAAQELAKYDND